MFEHQSTLNEKWIPQHLTKATTGLWKRVKAKNAA